MLVVWLMITLTGIKMQWDGVHNGCKEIYNAGNKLIASKIGVTKINKQDKK